MSTFQHVTDIELPVEKEVALEHVLPKHTLPDILDLLSKIFVYSPSARPTALECLRHS
jgi:glycogen synthase kinase 3 beta